MTEPAHEVIDEHGEFMATVSRGSGDEQAKAELGRVETDEVTVVFGPPTRGEVIAEAAHCPLLGVRSDPVHTEYARRTCPSR